MTNIIFKSSTPTRPDFTKYFSLAKQAWTCSTIFRRGSLGSGTMIVANQWTPHKLHMFNIHLDIIEMCFIKVYFKFIVYLNSCAWCLRQHCLIRSWIYTYMAIDGGTLWQCWWKSPQWRHLLAAKISQVYITWTSCYYAASSTTCHFVNEGHMFWFWWLGDMVHLQKWGKLCLVRVLK